MADKCIAEIKVRITEPLEFALMRLAAGVDKTMSDYVRAVLMDHAFGHTRIFAQVDRLAQSESCGTTRNTAQNDI